MVLTWDDEKCQRSLAELARTANQGEHSKGIRRRIQEKNTKKVLLDGSPGKKG